MKVRNTGLLTGVNGEGETMEAGRPVKSFP